MKYSCAFTTQTQTKSREYRSAMDRLHPRPFRQQCYSDVNDLFEKKKKKQPTTKKNKTVLNI